MADPVNPPSTDMVTQSTPLVLDQSLSVALGMLYQSAAHANGLAMTNATSNQQNMNQLNASIVSKGVMNIFSA